MTLRMRRWCVLRSGIVVQWRIHCEAKAVLSVSSDGRVRSALITGGTSGLGRAMAVALTEVGISVALTGRSIGSAREVASALPGNAIGIAMDVTDEASVTNGVDEAWDRLEGVDMLVNNAGIGMGRVNPEFLTRAMPYWEVSTGGFRAVVETNLTGYFLVAKAITPRMLTAGEGRIVMVSVSEATMRRPGAIPYGPSRAGSESMARIMAADLQNSEITVNVLLPGGPTLTGQVPPGTDTGGREFLDSGIMGPPIVWLASKDAYKVSNERIVATDFDDWLRARQR
jgi:gluconate 5-dehydrogenase